MENELKVNGIQKFMGIEIPIIEGGFGENCRVLTANTIAEIHNSRLDKINELIRNNISEFEVGIDIIDLVNDEKSLNLAKGLGFITNNRQKHCYILSEQGYMLLVGFMKTDKSKEIRKKLRRDYFIMREIINSDEQKKACLLLKIYDGGQDAVVASKELSKIEVHAATIPLLQKIEEDKPYTEFAKHITKSSDTVDVGEFAKIVKNENIDIGRNRLFAWLRENKYLMSNNNPYQKYIENHYFEVVETTKETAYGTKIFTKTLITGRGQIAIVEKLREEFGEAA